jgi:UDP-N-acetylmuramyl pentapeptide phosphotransferase/UDP-N-acetylglucosamine-1-phosphate transferase
MGNVNWLSMIIAALIPIVMGFIWYHKALFGKAWMASIGMTEEKAKTGNMPVMFGVTIIMSFFLALFLINNVNPPGQEGEFDTFKHGAFHGALIGFLVAMPLIVTNGLFELRSWKNMMITLGYWIITLALMAGVLDAMNHWPNEGVLG